MSTGPTVMAPRIQVFLQVAVLCCVVTTSIGGIADFQKAFSELRNEVKEIRQQSREETKSLHQKIEQLERRLEPLATEGWFRYNFK